MPLPAASSAAIAQETADSPARRPRRAPPAPVLVVPFTPAPSPPLRAVQQRPGLRRVSTDSGGTSHSAHQQQEQEQGKLALGGVPMCRTESVPVLTYAELAAGAARVMQRYNDPRPPPRPHPRAVFSDPFTYTLTAEPDATSDVDEDDDPPTPHAAHMHHRASQPLPYATVAAAPPPSPRRASDMDAVLQLRRTAAAERNGSATPSRHTLHAAPLSLPRLDEDDTPRPHYTHHHPHPHPHRRRR